MAVTGHDPARPSWDCRTCPDATPWPCAPAKVRLGERYGTDLTGLAVYMRRQFDEAVRDLRPQGDQRELHERFMAWTRPRRPR